MKKLYEFAQMRRIHSFHQTPTGGGVNERIPRH